MQPYGETPVTRKARFIGSYFPRALLKSGYSASYLVLYVNGTRFRDFASADSVVQANFRATDVYRVADEVHIIFLVSVMSQTS